MCPDNYTGGTSTSCGDFSCNGTETCSTCPSDCGTCPSKNPAAHWKLDEQGGTTASDSSGNNLNGTLQNGPVWTTGKISGALNFDGTDDSLTSATGGGGSAGFFYTEAFTPTVAAGAIRTIFSDAGTITGYKVEIDAAGKLVAPGFVNTHALASADIQTLALDAGEEDFAASRSYAVDGAGEFELTGEHPRASALFALVQLLKGGSTSRLCAS